MLGLHKHLPLSRMIAESRVNSLLRSHLWLTSRTYTLSYWVSIRSNVPYKYSMSRRRRVSPHFLWKFFLSFVYDLYAGAENAATRETDRRPSTPVKFLFTSLPVEVSQIVKTDSVSSDTYRPCALHDLVIVVKTSCCCFCIVTQHARLVERRARRRKTSGFSARKVNRAEEEFLFPFSLPLELFQNERR